MQIDATDFSLCDVSEACRELGGNKKTPSLVFYFIFFKVTLFFFHKLRAKIHSCGKPVLCDVTKGRLLRSTSEAALFYCNVASVSAAGSQCSFLQNALNRGLRIPSDRASVFLFISWFQHSDIKHVYPEMNKKKLII